ncbi:hypothetical protein Tco_0964715 [Tanacetum coccineum]
MEKAVLKQQFEAFIISSSKGLEKGYDRFQQLLSQLEAHGAEKSTEDANHKFLRSLPPAWSNLAMTMRAKPDVDTLSIDDFKSNNNKVKSGHTGPYSTYTPSTSSNNIPEREVPAGFADEVIYSLFAKQSKDLDLLHEDLEQIDDVDIKEIRQFHGMDDAKEIWEAIRTRFGGNANSKKMEKAVLKQQFEAFSISSSQGAGKKEQNQNCLLTMDDGVVN